MVLSTVDKNIESFSEIRKKINGIKLCTNQFKCISPNKCAIFWAYYDVQRERQTDREIEIDRDRDTETETERQREKCKFLFF